MTIYTLYIKTHKITGLKYLGKTTQNPFKYLGSGKDWLTHLKKYGNEHYTEIVMECQTKEEFNYWGRYYSKLWNIVNSQDDYGNKIWANRIPETGGGGLIGSDNPMAKQEIKDKHLSAVRLANKNKEMVANRSASLKKVFSTQEHKLIRSLSQKIAQNNPVVVKKRSKTMTVVQNNPIEKEKRSGKKSYRYDHTIYKFLHLSGIIEICTRQEFQIKYKFTAQYVRHIIQRPGKYTRLGWVRDLAYNIAQDDATIY